MLKAIRNLHVTSPHIYQKVAAPWPSFHKVAPKTSAKWTPLCPSFQYNDANAVVYGGYRCLATASTASSYMQESHPNNQIDLPLGIVEDPFWENTMEPKKCVGCGATFQTIKPESEGYVHPDTFNEFSGGRKKIYPKVKGEMIEDVPTDIQVQTQISSKYRVRTQLLLCRRCYRLQHYKRLDKRDKTIGTYSSHDASEVANKVLSGIRKDSLVIKIVDILDLESSVVPELFEGCRNRRLQVIWVINKIDCLPKGADLQRIKIWIRRMVRQINNAHFDDIVFVSSATGFNFDKLEERMQQFVSIENPKNIYVVGRVNAGKSCFVTRFLKFIGYRHFGTIYMKRGVGGTTRSAVPGTTLQFIPFGLPKGFQLIDTPGIPNAHQMTAYLKNEKDLNDILPMKRMQPVAYSLQKGQSLLIGGLARVDFTSGIHASCTCYFSRCVMLLTCSTNEAEKILRKKVGNTLHPPHHSEDYETLKPFECHRVEIYAGSRTPLDDIVVAGLGWISITGEGKKEFDVWVPQGVQVFRRPAMLSDQRVKTNMIKFNRKLR